MDYLDAVLLDVVDENDANSVEDDLFHTDNWVEELIEDHRGLALRSGKHGPEFAPPRSRNFSEGPTNIMMALSEFCRHYFKTGQLVDIDEMCIYFKGRHRCKCYDPNKTNKWHFKLFCWNDSKT